MLVATLLVAQPPQEEERKLNGGSITVVKAYDPTLSDAFKVKTVPNVADTIQVQKKPVTYNIFSVPVASTFTPAKGKLSKLKAKPRRDLYESYARLGVGNYVNVLAEFAATLEIDRESDFNVFMNHNSSQGGISEVEADDDYSNTLLDLSYNRRLRDLDFTVAGGVRYRNANWYGDFMGSPVRLTEDSDVVTDYLSYGAGGELNFYNSVFNSVDLKFTGIISGYDASENRLRAKPSFKVDVLDTQVTADIDLDYLTGSFDQPAFIGIFQDYSYFNSNLNPSVNLYGDKYKVQLGATLNYLSDLENSDGTFNVYPDIVASYTLLNQYFIAYSTIGGGQDINSLQQITEENVFIAPAVNIFPTHRQIDAVLGIKGSISKLGYNVYGGYKIQENQYVFVNNQGLTSSTADRLPYQYGNTFELAYVDLNTAMAGLSLSFDFTEDINVAVTSEYFNYDVDAPAVNDVASHLPELTLDLTGNYRINEKWNVGTTLYYMGEREAFRNGVGTQDLDAFVDLNLDVNYQINPQLGAFLRGNNLTGGNYQYFNGYPVQDLQIMGGAVYQFDF